MGQEEEASQVVKEEADDPIGRPFWSKSDGGQLLMGYKRCLDTSVLKQLLLSADAHTIFRSTMKLLVLLNICAVLCSSNIPETDHADLEASETRPVVRRVQVYKVSSVQQSIDSVITTVITMY